MKAATLKDGFGIRVAFTGHDFSLYLDPTSITPPGVDGGDPIQTTTHTNSAYRTKHPRSLKELTDSQMTVAYDPGEYTNIKNCINANTTITFTFPDDGACTIAIRGYMKSFQPKELTEGEMPTADVTIVTTNEAADGTESAPVVTP